MKTVQLLAGAEFVTNENGGKVQMVFTTYDLCKMCVNAQKQGGLNVEEIGTRLGLLSKLNEFETQFTAPVYPSEGTDEERKSAYDASLEEFGKLTADLELEDSEYSALKALVNEKKWPIAAQFIYDFGKSFR